MRLSAFVQRSRLNVSLSSRCFMGNWVVNIVVPVRPVRRGIHQGSRTVADACVTSAPSSSNLTSHHNQYWAPLFFLLLFAVGYLYYL